MLDVDVGTLSDIDRITKKHRRPTLLGERHVLDAMDQPGGLVRQISW